MNTSYFFKCVSTGITFIFLFSIYPCFAQSKGNQSSTYRYQSMTFVEKKVLANSIFQKLLEAHGPILGTTPAFELLPKNPPPEKDKYEGKAAYMDKEQHIIGIEERAFNLCMKQQGREHDALAVLISHEIIHYVKHKDNFKAFNNHFQENDTEQIKEEEKEADYLGGFLAYQAGFTSFEVITALLDSIYDSYNLVTHKKYPSLDTRKAIAEQGLLITKKLATTFDLANYSSLLGEYEWADTCYKYILNFYKSPEISNNAGVNAVLAGLKYNNPFPRYLYPFTLDMNSQLCRGNNVPPSIAIYKAYWLKKAKDYLDNVTTFQRRYATGNLNRACLLHLLLEANKDNLELEVELEISLKRATVYADSAKDDVVLAGVATLKGILAFEKGDKTEATKQAELAKKLGGVASAYIVDYNLATFKEEFYDFLKYKTAPKKEETIQHEGTALLFEAAIHSVTDLTIQVKEYQHSEILSCSLNGKPIITIHRTKKTYPHSLTNNYFLKIGTTMNQVTRYLHQPIPFHRIRDTDVNQKFRRQNPQIKQGIDLRTLRQGSALIYRTSSFICFADQNNNLTHWITYTVTDD